MSRSRALRFVALLAVLLLGAAACSSHPEPTGTKTLLIAVNAPFSEDAFVGQTIYQGVKLAADQLNGTDGFDIGTVRYTISVKKYDNALSPEQAVANVRTAVADGAVAIVDEGTGIDASWPVANAAGVPTCIVYQGGEGQVDPVTRPNVLRIEPTYNGIAFL